MADDIIAVYPSLEDSERLVEDYPVLDGISIGILGPEAETHLFSFSDRSNYKNLSDNQKNSGVGLSAALPKPTGSTGL